MGWFTRPLPASLRPAEYGHPEGFDFPNTVDLDSVAYPEFHGVADSPEAHRGVTGELFQDTAPEYAGQYELGFIDQPGTVPSQTYLAPAPGSQDLVAPRDTGGVPGTNRVIHSVGPVDGAGTDGGATWSSVRTDLHTPVAQQGGPVTGGPDYGHSLNAAYYAQAQAQYNLASAEAAMVAAI
jgi:hypothetical protein